jgi:hypothetical protein
MFIEVGGPSKAFNLAAFGQQLQSVAAYAQSQGGAPVFFCDRGTPQSAIDLAAKWFCHGNVRPIP